MCGRCGWGLRDPNENRCPGCGRTREQEERDLGLVSRKILRHHGPYADIEEVWDLTAPGVPFVPFKGKAYDDG
jgi:hypothetical protein